MKVFGSLSELVSIVFRKDGQNQTLRPSQAVTYTAARDYQLPPQDASSTIVSIDATQTLSNKTISGAANTISGVSLTAGVSGILPPANGGTGVANSTTLTLGANNTTLVTSGTTSVTLPTTGTLATLSGSETLNNKVIANTSTILIKDSNLTIQNGTDTTKTVQFLLSGLTTGTLRTLTVPDASITLVGRADTATLSNKTLDSSNVTNLTDANFTLLNTSDPTKTVKFLLSGLTTSTQRTLTVPDANLTIVGTATTQTLTNKTIDASANTVTNVSLTTAVTGILPISSGGTGAVTKTTAFNALSPETTKGDLISFDGTNNIRVAAGADGTVLSADSTQTSGLKYISTLTNPMTTLGDIIVGGSSGAATRLGIGASGTVLKGGTTPTYAQIVDADISSSAAISYSKLSLTGSIVNADIATGAAIAYNKLAALPSANVLVGSAGNVATAVAVTGDVTISNAGVTAIGSGKVTSTMILDGTIVDADINASAAIAGTKVSPAFGTQNITTTGTLGLQSTTVINSAVKTADTLAFVSFGTFTPVSRFGTSNGTKSDSGAVGQWQRIGNFMFVRWEIVVSKGTAVGALFIGGLPMNAAGDCPLVPGLVTNVGFTPVTSQLTYRIGDATSEVIVGLIVTGTSFASVNASDLGASAAVYGAGVYRVS